jgi:hypothetical protein
MPFCQVLIHASAITDEVGPTWGGLELGRFGQNESGIGCPLWADGCSPSQSRHWVLNPRCARVMPRTHRGPSTAFGFGSRGVRRRSAYRFSPRRHPDSCLDSVACIWIGFSGFGFIAAGLSISRNLPQARGWNGLGVMFGTWASCFLFRGLWGSMASREQRKNRTSLESLFIAIAFWGGTWALTQPFGETAVLKPDMSCGYRGVDYAGKSME